MRRDTGPTSTVRAMVIGRDGSRCVRCGLSRHPETLHLHHRRPRGMGGTRRDDTNQPSNLISLCVGCHTRVETDRVAARDYGWLVPQYANPADVPIRTALYGWVLLLPDGSIVADPEAVVA